MSYHTTIQREDFQMNHFKTDLVLVLVTKQDLTEIFRIHLETVMNHLLET